MGTRVRHRCPTVPPKKQRQPLLQFGVGGQYLLDVPQILEMAMKQRGAGRQEWLDLYATAMGAQHPTGIQRGAGILSFLLRPLARLFNKKAAKAVAQRVAKKVTKKAVKRVAKKAAKKAAMGTATAAGLGLCRKPWISYKKGETLRHSP